MKVPNFLYYIVLVVLIKLVTSLNVASLDIGKACPTIFNFNYNLTCGIVRTNRVQGSPNI